MQIQSKKRPRIVPLSSSFFFMSIMGLYVSIIYISSRWPDFGFAFAIIFAVMFISSLISLTYAPAKLLLKLEEYEKKHKGGKFLSYVEHEKNLQRKTKR